jgi:hypothetical protein
MPSDERLTTVSKETRAKMSQTKMGHEVSKETRAKLRQAQMESRAKRRQTWSDEDESGIRAKDIA